MPIDFPNNPTLNQTHTIGSVVWEWNGVAWTVKNSGIGQITLNDLTDVAIVEP